LADVYDEDLTYRENWSLADLVAVAAWIAAGGADGRTGRGR